MNQLENFSRLSARRSALVFTVAMAFVLAGCKARGADQPLAFAPAPDGRPQNSYADVVSKVAPAVVTIRADKRVRVPQQFPFMDDPFFRGLFGNRMPQQQPQESLERALGSGVIASADGYIVTNHHVVDGAEQIKIDLTDGRTLDAKLIGSDAPSDLALLKISGSGLPFLTPGNSDQVRVGDVALAIGNPLGIGQTVTMGIISAKGRSTAGPGAGNFEDFLQTDAPINQGNSGGALINTNGELIGINSQIVPGNSGGNIGIGFAIPSNMVRSVTDQLAKSGKVRRGQLGVGVERVTSDIAESLGMPEAKGVIISSVRPGSAAERAGIRRGDIITAIDNSPVADTNAFRNHVASLGPGAETTLTILRENREQKIKATLGEFVAENAKTGEESESGAAGPASGKLGVSVVPLTPDLAQQLRLPASTQGVVIEDVDPAGAAAEAGMRQGDVIEEVNRQPVRSAADLKAAIDKAGNKPALLLINRGGNSAYVTVKPRG